MGINRMFFEMGWAFGLLAGLTYTQSERKMIKILRPEDLIIKEYADTQSIIYMEDIIGYVGLDNTNGNRISIGHSLSKLGWRKRRSSDMRWYYERGMKALGDGG